MKFPRLTTGLAALLCFACGAGDGGDREFGSPFGGPVGGTDPGAGSQPPPPSGGAPAPGAGSPPPGAGGPPPGGGDPGVPPTPGTAPGGQVGIKDDPNDGIDFDWEETAPGSICRAGHYVGTFEGTWASSFTFVGVPIPVTGNVDMWLEESSNGEFLEVSQGTISGVADFVFPYEVSISGRLDCRTKQFENGVLQNGIYIVPGLPPVDWDGTVTASYDKTKGAFVNATWAGAERVNPAFTGSGFWTAEWVP